MYSVPHNTKFSTCIQEMEATEEILNQRWNQIQTSAPSRSKKSVEKLLVKLRDRQCITAAALQALDAYERLKGERSDFRTRKDSVVRAFQNWLRNVDAESTSGSGSGSEGELDAEEQQVMREYSEYRKLSQAFATKWTHFRKSDKKVTKNLADLNTRFGPLAPQRLSKIKTERLAGVKWPSDHCKKLSSTVELAFDQINFMTKLLNQIDTKLERLEVFFRINQSSIVLETHEPSGRHGMDDEDEDMEEGEYEQDFETD